MAPKGSVSAFLAWKIQRCSVELTPLVFFIFYFYVAYGVACHLVACIIHHHTKASMISVLMTMAALQRKSVAVAVCRMPVAARVISSTTSRQCLGKATDISYSLLLDFEKSRNAGRTQPLKKTCLHYFTFKMRRNDMECHGNLATKWQ